MSREYRSEFIEHIENCDDCIKLEESELDEDKRFELQSECYEGSK